MSLIKLFSEVLLVAEDRVNEQLTFKDVPRWDSLAHMMLIARVEETYSIQMTGEEIASIRSFGDLKRIVSGHGVSA